MSVLDIVLDRRPEPKEAERLLPLPMYGEDYDLTIQYWQEPILTVEELFPEEHKEQKPYVKQKSIPVQAPLVSYRQYTNNQF